MDTGTGLIYTQYLEKHTMAKDVFLTNGTGYIGQPLVRALKEKGYNVTALSRSDESTQKLNTLQVKAHRGDITKPETFVDAAKQADIIIHTAATRDANFAKNDEATVAALLDAIKGSNKTFIYTSGTWVLGSTGPTLGTEDSGYNAPQPVKFRTEVEKTVIAAAKNATRAIVLRPALVYGGNGGLLEQTFIRAAEKGEVQQIGPGENSWTFVDVDDLADLYVLAVEKGVAGQIYHGAHGAPLKVKDFSEQVAKAYGLAGKVRTIPVEEARQGLGFIADALTLDNQIDAAKTKRDLGWQPRRPSVSEFAAQRGRALAGSTR
jgi:nucleoside-diphosphate-sugar epimerase